MLASNPEALKVSLGARSRHRQYSIHPFSVRRSSECLSWLPWQRPEDVHLVSEPPSCNVPRFVLTLQGKLLPGSLVAFPRSSPNMPGLCKARRSLPRHIQPKPGRVRLSIHADHRRGSVYKVDIPRRPWSTYLNNFHIWLVASMVKRHSAPDHPARFDSALFGVRPDGQVMARFTYEWP